MRYILVIAIALIMLLQGCGPAEEGTQSIPDNSSESLDYGYIALGDPITYADETGKQILTVTAVEVYDDISACGLTEGDLGRYRDADLANTFVLIRLSIENVVTYSRAMPYTVINMLLLNKYIYENLPAVVMPEPVYFEDSGEKPGGYYTYQLEEGEKRDFAVGFLLNEDVKEPADLLLHIGVTFDEPFFVDLGADNR